METLRVTSRFGAAARSGAADARRRARQVGLSEDELARREHMHRGVYCRPGLLLPTPSTLFHLCPAQHFNSLLPLGPRRPYTCPGFTPVEGILACRVRRCSQDATRRLPARADAAPCTRPRQDTATLCHNANLTYRQKGDTRMFYVLQIEVDMLLATVLPEEVDEWEGEEQPRTARNLRIVGPVNELAITRMWIASRDGSGAFINCDPPTRACPRHGVRMTCACTRADCVCACRQNPPVTERWGSSQAL